MTLVGSLFDGEFSLPATRLPSGRGTRAVADGDEDAVTLAAEAGLALLDRNAATPRALILASTSLPYDEGGSVQALAEILGLAGEIVALELSASLRDGITALRVAASLARCGQGPVLVCASHRSRGEHDAGDGAAAVLVDASGGVATLRFGAARAEELRDRWRLATGADRAEADPSFVWDEGASGIARRLDAGALGTATFSSPVAKSAARAEKALDGPGDPLAPRTGVLGAAHPLARILLGLDGPLAHVASAGGLVDTVAVEPSAGAGEVADRARAVLEAEALSDRPAPVDWSQLTPYASAPRSWRERGQDLRLEGKRCGSCSRLLFPPPETCANCGSRDLSAERLPRTGTVLTQTRDRVYPAGRSTGMAVVDLDGGGRFFGQVVPSGTVEIGSRVQLVPRRLHDGGGAAQYFWKLAPLVEEGA
jgi:uncharacterized OB-fold protein